jgi:hypothetical protein
MCAKAVVASLVVLSVLARVVPTASVDVSKLFTWAVVAICVVFTVVAAVGAAGVPVKVGEAKGASNAKFPCTNAVVAICVVLVANDAVGAVGVPVNAGEFNGARPTT